MYIEYIVIGALILFQLYIAVVLFNKIRQYKVIFELLPIVEQKRVPINIFNSKDINTIINSEIESDIDDFIEITILRTKTKNKIFNRLINQINGYLIKNKNATIDFHLIKDIVDRNTEIIEDDVNNRIPAPLYIGLAATMLGIIFGLFSVNFTQSDNALNSMQPLIEGVKIAMSASVLGLIITTIFSVKIFKDANFKVEDDKNNFLSQLLSDLLPKMNKSKIPEVETLSKKLDHFARNTSNVITKFNDIVIRSSNSIDREQELISNVKSLNVTKMTSANVEVFNHLNSMMDSFENFANYYNELNKSMTSTSSLLTNLNTFVTNTNSIKEVLEQIKKVVVQSEQSANFFNQHITTFKKYDLAINEVVANSNSAFLTAIGELKNRTNEQFNEFNTVIASYDSKLTEAFNNSIINFNKTMEAQILKTEQAFENSRPKFEKLNQLDKLDKLEKIEQKLTKLEIGLKEVFTKNSNNIIDTLLKINISGSNNTGLSPIIEKSKISKKVKIFDYTLNGLKIVTYVIIIVVGIYILIDFIKYRS